MKRKEEREQAALYYANNLDDIKPNDEFSKNLCIALGQAYIKGAEWADENMKNKLIAELTKLRDNAIEEMKKDNTTSTPEYYSACGQAHAYVQVMNMIYEIF